MHCGLRLPQDFFQVSLPKAAVGIETFPEDNGDKSLGTFPEDNRDSGPVLGPNEDPNPEENIENVLDSTMLTSKSDLSGFSGVPINVNGSLLRKKEQHIASDLRQQFLKADIDFIQHIILENPMVQFAITR
ncbi:hypothetical protein BDR26DRAFT_895370 [Obelidium mucronatum]|nr:hypothetical protein BDR26DRAFT_895370 [Obelidium mucronatum]